MTDTDISLKDAPPSLRTNAAAADRLAHAIHDCDSEARGLHFTPWDELSTGQRMVYRSLAMDALKGVR